MLNYPDKKYSSFVVIIILTLVLWIIFTELVFTGNKILPSPKLLIISIYDLFKDYNFLFHLISTISVIYGALIFSFIVVKIKFSFINFESKSIRYLIPIINIFLFIPEIIIGLLLIYWLEDRYIAKLVFAFFISAIFIYQTFLNFNKNKISNRIVAAESAGISNQKINRNIVWKFIEPEILNNFMDKHTFLWSSIIAFEFIQNFSGTGYVLRNALRFQDLSIIITILILSAVIIFIGKGLILFIRKKYFNWN